MNVFQKCTLAFGKSSLETKSAMKIILIYSRNLSIKIPRPIVKIMEEPWSQAQRKKKCFVLNTLVKLKKRSKQDMLSVCYVLSPKTADNTTLPLLHTGMVLKH